MDGHKLHSAHLLHVFFFLLWGGGSAFLETEPAEVDRGRITSVYLHTSMYWSILGIEVRIQETMYSSNASKIKP